MNGKQWPSLKVRFWPSLLKKSALFSIPAYGFNDKNLPIGAAYWARLVERYLG
jgi:hippurate hydrolase